MKQNSDSRQISDISLTSPSDVKDFVIKNGFHPSKVLGQNFLVDANILNIIIDAAELHGDDQILEIGPGLGVVTERLLEKVKHVVAIEKDSRLFTLLSERWGDNNKLELINADALQCNLVEILSSGITGMVSNLPYSVGSRILIDIASAPVIPERMVVTLQNEVAQRLAALPGNKDFGLLTVRVQVSYDVSIIKKISGNCFWPSPNVESSVILLKRHSGYNMTESETKMFRRLLKVAFTHRRKQMHGILGKQFRDIPGISPDSVQDILLEADIVPQMRPGDIVVANWVGLAKICDELKNGADKNVY